MNEKIQDAIDQKLAQEAFVSSIEELKRSLAVGHSDIGALYTIEGLIEITKLEAENPQRLQSLPYDLNGAIKNGIETQEHLNDFLSIMKQNNVKPDQTRQFTFGEEKSGWLGKRTISRVRSIGGWIINYGLSDGYPRGFFVTTNGLVESSGLKGASMYSSDWRPGYTDANVFVKSLADRITKAGITEI